MDQICKNLQFLFNAIWTIFNKSKTEQQWKCQMVSPQKNEMLNILSTYSRFKCKILLFSENIKLK